MTTPDTLTICICTYNRGPKIEQTLAALLKLDERSVAEIVVVDNNSTDDTAQIIDQFIDRGTPFPVRRVLESKQGLLNARLRGVAECKSGLLGFVDDDIILDPGWARVIVDRFAESPRCGVVGGTVRLRWETGPSRLALRHTEKLAGQDLGDSSRELGGAGEALVGAAFVFRVEALRASGWVDQPYLTDRCGDEMTSGGDTEMVIRTRLSGFTVWYEPAAGCDHLIPPGRQTREYLLRLTRGVSSTEPWFKWMVEGSPRGEEATRWIETNLRRYRSKLRKTRWLEWRPDRRAFLITRRTARANGYVALAQAIREGRV